MLILGSQSPRRKTILGFFSIPFQQIPPDFDEDSIPWKGDPVLYTSLLSQGKARSLSTHYSDQPILTADTVVFREGKIYLKPKDEEDAFRIFSELVGQWHSVFTGVTLQKGSKVYTAVEETKVQFNNLTEKQIRQFLRQLPYADKAGGYFLYEAGSLLSRSIHGCFYNAMGLPINTVHDLLLKINIDLWNHLLPPTSA